MLLEAVPNLSMAAGDEGLTAVLDALQSDASPGWALLDVHEDEDHARTVLTMAGAPAPLTRALLTMVETAMAHGSLQGHRGVHPRTGLVDVLPVVPLAGASWSDAERLARLLGRRLGAHGIPVHYYGRLATRPKHRVLYPIRAAHRAAGEGAKHLAPDAGPRRPTPELGCACVGVRGLLVAYNVELNTTELGIGADIAREVRESTGGLPGVQALAFPLESREGRVQVSTNITDLDALAPAEVFATIKRLAAQRNVHVVQGELVGLAPERALPIHGRDLGLDLRPASLEDRLSQAGFHVVGAGPSGSTILPNHS